MNRIKHLFINPGSSFAYAIMTCLLSIMPESTFLNRFIIADEKIADKTIIIINRLLLCACIFVLFNAIYRVYLMTRRKVFISDRNYIIQIEYGDIFKTKGKKVISFDECFSTNVGEAPSDIKPNSICGQYLKKVTQIDIKQLLKKAEIKPASGKSQYNDADKYIPGTIIPNEEFMLLAFAKLDENGLGKLTYEEYIECLDVLWEQIDLYHGTSDVCIPILGSGVTTRFDKELTQQELLDIIICSYRLTPNKLKRPSKLHIICKACDGFSINNAIGVR